MRCWVARNTAAAVRLMRRLRWGGRLRLPLGMVLFMGVVAFLQSPGLVAADTKHDLSAHPGAFLRAATQAYTAAFPLGQLQNQAYGYLFPQGAFFAAAAPLPDWVAQRLWWWLVTAVGAVGFYWFVLRLYAAARAGAPAAGLRVVRAAAAATAVGYALSPHTVATVGAISSETWPAMVAPWIVAPLVVVPAGAVSAAGRLRWRAVAAAVVAVGCLGGINATASAAACVPAGLYLLWRRRWRELGLWCAGAVAVSAWWLGPLLVLGAYSPPFTDFIENAQVTTAWLNPMEILRGATSWAPFVSTERAAGFATATVPALVLVSCVVAACAVAGLAGENPAVARRAPRFLAPADWSYVVLLLLVGVAALGAAQGPWGAGVREFLDGPGAALRNVHKADVWVRLPLGVGLWALLAAVGQRAWDEAVRGAGPGGPWRRACAYPSRAGAALALVLVAVGASMAPALRGDLAPVGAFARVPSYWQQTAAYLNQAGPGTRTLIAPEASFARQRWGWTRDEPLQPLLEVPWVVRDAIPLVDPEAIRGLDGLMAVLESPAVPPAGAVQVLARMGIGRVVIRHDLAVPGAAGKAAQLSHRLRPLAARARTFGQVEVLEFNPVGAWVGPAPQQGIQVIGSGEAFALVPALVDASAALFAAPDAAAGDGGADPAAPLIVTDTPAQVVRNFGTLDGAVSAIRGAADPKETGGRAADYPSAAPAVVARRRTPGVEVTASNSAAQATTLGGARPARGVDAATDGDPLTAWYPQPGRAGELHVRLPRPVTQVELTPAGVAGTAQVTAGGGLNKTVELSRAQPTTISFDGIPLSEFRVAIAPQPGGLMGIAELRVPGIDLGRDMVLATPPRTPQAWLFQQLLVPTGLLQRTFTLPQEADYTPAWDDCALKVELDNRRLRCGESIRLEAGEHTLRTHAAWVRLAQENLPAPVPLSPADYSGPATPHRTDLPTWTLPHPASGAAAQVLHTTLAANAGLRATLTSPDGSTHRLEPIQPIPGMQSFALPTHATGTVALSFAGQRPYRVSLLSGAALWLALMAAATWLLTTRPAGRAGGAGASAAASAPHPAVLLTLSAATSILIAGAGGGIGWALGAGGAHLLARRPGARRLVALWAGALVTLGGILLTHGAWGSGSYAGASPLTGGAALAALGALSTTGIAQPARRALN